MIFSTEAQIIEIDSNFITRKFIASGDFEKGDYYEFSVRVGHKYNIYRVSSSQVKEYEKSDSSYLEKYSQLQLLRKRGEYTDTIYLVEDMYSMIFNNDSIALNSLSYSFSFEKKSFETERQKILINETFVKKVEQVTFHNIECFKVSVILNGELNVFLINSGLGIVQHSLPFCSYLDEKFL